MKKKIGLGTWSWGNKVFWNYQTSNDYDLRETYKEVLKRGFYLIDSADSYGTGEFNGRSEELLGKFLVDTPFYQKKSIQIATKLAPRLTASKPIMPVPEKRSKNVLFSIMPRISNRLLRTIAVVGR